MEFLKFWPILAFLIPTLSASGGLLYKVSDNEEKITEVQLLNTKSKEEIRAEVAAKILDIWTRLREMGIDIKENEKSINDLLRGDDKLAAQLELQAAKLEARIAEAARATEDKLSAQDTVLEEQSRQLKDIILLLRKELEDNQ